MRPAIDVTALAQGAVDAVKAVGPWILVAASVVVLIRLLSRPGRTELRLALRGLVGGRRSRGRQLLTGLAIPLLAVAALTVSFALEHELRTGPNRMVDHLAGSTTQTSWLLEADTSHFMNDSRLPGRLVAQARRVPGTVAVWEQLSDVADQGGERFTSLILARGRATDGPATGFAVKPDGARCRVSGGTCVPAPGQAIVDADLAAPGQHLHLRDKDLTVVANFAAPASLLNRSVLAVNPSAFDRPGGSRERPYAVIAPNADVRRQLAAVVAARPERRAVEFRSTAQIRAANKRFWAGNGTPLLLILILIVLAFGTISYFAARRAAQEQARPAVATLMALGVAPTTLARSELARALLNVLVAGVIGFPVAAAVVALADSQIVGFHAVATLHMVLAAMGAMVLVAVITTALLYVQVRSLDVPRAMNA